MTGSERAIWFLRGVAFAAFVVFFWRLYVVVKQNGRF
jgi:hypothetical protein